MLGVLIAVALLSGGCAHIVGYAFVAPSESLLRSRGGGMLLGACVLVALAGPMLVADGLSAGLIGRWPAGFGPDVYRVLWVALAAVGLLSGMRAWRIRFRRGGVGAFKLDESPAARVDAQLPFADSLDGALDVLARESPSQREIERVADAIRTAGDRFWHELPQKDSEVYNVVRGHVPAVIAPDVTRLLLEGAQRKARARGGADHASRK